MSADANPLHGPVGVASAPMRTSGKSSSRTLSDPLINLGRAPSAPVRQSPAGTPKPPCPARPHSARAGQGDSCFPPSRQVDG